jgi:hypothetical protein
MKRKIVGYDMDKEHDWRAKLECGHYQHVRQRRGGLPALETNSSAENAMSKNPKIFREPR